MEIKWRRYEKKDSEDLFSFLSKCEDESLNFLGKDHDFLKGEYHKIMGLINDEEIIAFGYLWENENYPDVPSLGIVIRDDWQGKGIGQQLMYELIKLGVELQAKAIYLSVHPDNIIAVHIYEKLGWKVTGKRKDSSKLEMLREM